MTMLHRALLKIRPEPLAAALKAALRISRYELATPYGRFFIDPASNFGARLQSAEGYEPVETAAILALTRDAKTFVDVGANEGYFAVIAARNMPAGGRVIAIEPQQRLLPVLRKNMSLNGLSSEIVICAVGDHEGTANMFVSSSLNTGTTGMVRTTLYPRRRKVVRIARLEKILEEKQVSLVDCMKIDIEGLEYEAIFGSRRLFQDRMIKNMLIELHPRQMAQRGRDPRRLVEFLAVCGYRNDGSIWRSS